MCEIDTNNAHKSAEKPSIKISRQRSAFNNRHRDCCVKVENTTDMDHYMEIRDEVEGLMAYVLMELGSYKV